MFRLIKSSVHKSSKILLHLLCTHRFRETVLIFHILGNCYTLPVTKNETCGNSVTMCLQKHYNFHNLDISSIKRTNKSVILYNLSKKKIRGLVLLCKNNSVFYSKMRWNPSCQHSCCKIYQFWGNWRCYFLCGVRDIKKSIFTSLVA